MRFSWLIFFFCLAFCAAAQDSLQKQSAPNTYVQMCEVKMNNGETYKGEVKQENDSVIVLLLPKGRELRAAKSQVAHLTYYMAKNKAKFLKEINTEHIGGCFYGATRNAFLFVPQRMEISLGEFLLYHYNYNINKNYSVGVTASLFAAPILAHAKAHYQLAPKAYLGFEAYGGIGFPMDPFFVGAGAMKITIGDYNQHLTATFSLGSAQSDVLYAYGLGGSKHLAGDVYLVSELWAAKDLNGGALTLGLRTVVKPRVSWLWGIGALVGDVAKTSLTKYFAPFPYFGFAFRT